MGMLVVNDDDFEKQINNVASEKPRPSSVTKVSEVLPAKPLGRGPGNVEVPNALRQLIGATHLEEGRSEAISLANEFGISHQSAAAYAKGATSLSSYNEPKTENKNHIRAVKDSISRRAQSKLKKALTHIDDDKLKVASARELAGVAKDMSQIVKAMEPDNANGAAGNAPQFVIYAPRVINENHFESITVNE